MICLLLCCVSCQQKNDEKKGNVDRFAVATDIHVVADSLFTEDNIASYETTDKMLHLSEPIFKTIADQLIDGKYKFLLLAGDLTENGDRVSHRAVTAILKKLEDAGVDVFVINGNHDVMSNAQRKNYSVTQDEFKELYYDYGYGEAVSVLPGTLCYSADIQNKFRLIALDNIAYYTDASQTSMIPEVSDEKILWIQQQAEEAADKGLRPILLSHKGFINHWPGLMSIISEKVPDKYAHLPSALAFEGAYLGFVGHNHLNDIVVKDVNGKKYYEAQTGSTIFCESNYRSVSYSDDVVKIETITLNNIDVKAISPYVSEDVITEVEADFPSYSYNHFSRKINNTVRSYVEKIFNKIDFGNDIFENILKNEIIYAAFSLPFYEKDAQNEECLERIINKYGITLPQTDYKTFWDIIPYMVSSLIKGNENMRNSDEITISKYVAYSLFYFFNKKSDDIASLCKDNKKINVDLKKLFEEGVLECYESNLIPAITSIALNSNIGLKMQLLFSSIASNFVLITNFSDIIESLSGSVIKDIGQYFDEYSVDFEHLIENGFFDKYINDLLQDTEPNDKEVTIKIHYEED